MQETILERIAYSAKRIVVSFDNLLRFGIDAA